MFSCNVVFNTNPGLPALGPKRGDVVEYRIVRRFLKEAGQLLVDEIHRILGTQQLYTLNTEYAKVKPTLIGYKAYSNKSPGQPLIFTGAMYDAVTYKLGDGSVEIFVDMSKVPLRGEDYVEVWEERVQYLEKALAVIEPKFAQLMVDVIVSEIGL